ncbi:thiamine ABC transporter ATP-binding protein [Aurantimonas sp. VKM B-3413]|uniref:thiamine ABC transporter ATP-binding protein n=1 Tax=Aurantimonas sp. VKM B-3413 TaxID=2779401 RepID=UPI001E5C4D74|nr:thiamine ABC transporter ATP-binding protein [Aurantimonas sp. VKM B-3413]MCB8840729.1 thiamine ABC transporter ATP-binding protein [Aurantimonas sp. VKM B-3413]
MSVDRLKTKEAPAAGSVPALEMADVRFSYADLAMRFDLRVESGEWLAVIGPSGAGKSTLFDLAAGFAEPESGTIRIAGADMEGVAPAERPLSLVFQDNNLFPHLDVFRNVALGVAPNLKLQSAQKDAVAEAIAEVGLTGFERRRPAEMSGGERQRVALARAFVRQRPLLLLDEPFAALGPALRSEMLELIGSLRQANGRDAVTVIMITHDPEDAAGRTDRTAFVEAGRIAVVGPTGEILSGAGDERVARYLGSRPNDRRRISGEFAC